MKSAAEVMQELRSLGGKGSGRYPKGSGGLPENIHGSGRPSPGAPKAQGWQYAHNPPQHGSKSNVEHVADVERSIREDNQGLDRENEMSLGRIPTDRLKEEIDYSVKAKDTSVTVKIPSGSEFTMTLPQARAVYAHLTKFDRPLGSWR